MWQFYPKEITSRIFIKKQLGSQNMTALGKRTRIHQVRPIQKVMLQAKSFEVIPND
jgi:hypothetical protein